MVDDQVDLALRQRRHGCIDLRVGDVALEGHTAAEIHLGLAGQPFHVAQMLTPHGRVGMEQRHALQAQALAVGDQGAKLLPVFGPHRKDQRLMRAAQAGWTGDGAEEGDIAFDSDLHHGRRRPAFDRTEQDERCLLYTSRCV